ncbi:hypothetical protein LX81_03629 [Palleronia aestuarii]|uniref:Uncharacterized protein n=1 Tax=Palleronia aestuarii TaxID=568105 RepID=A0A2W7MXI3_9RHOB|nr:hypothetical protein LX81_03629 [Palleronia aestuarii]
MSGKAEADEKEGEIEKLHAKIGQFVVERDRSAKGESVRAPLVLAHWRAAGECGPEA